MNSYPGAEARKYLEQVYRLDRAINLKLAKAETYRQMAMNTTTRYSSLPRSASPNLQRNETLLAKAVDAEREADAEIDRLIDLKDEILTLGNRLGDPTLQLILVERYVNLRKWSEVAASLSLCERRVMQYNTRLLRRFEEVMKSSDSPSVHSALGFTR